MTANGVGDYKPGTVAVATVRGVPNVRVFRRYSHEAGVCDWAYNPEPDRGLVYSCDSDIANVVTDIRPLVVLDLESALDHMGGGMSDLPDVLKDMRRGGGIFAGRVADQIEQQTKPPRIPEPGWGSKVIASTVGNDRRRTWLVVAPGVLRTEAGGAALWPALIDPELVQ